MNPQRAIALAVLSVCAVFIPLAVLRNDQDRTDHQPSAGTKMESHSLTRNARTHERSRSSPASEPMPAPLAEPGSRPPSATDLLPPSEQASFRAALHQARHSIHPLTPAQAGLPHNEGVTHFTANPGQNITARFLDNGGVRINSGTPGETWQATLRLKDAPASGVWKTEATRGERDHGGITEWYENRSDGIEHGFTVSSRPQDSAANAPLTLRISTGELHAEADPQRPTDLLFTDPVTRQPVLGYRDLKVWDADGTPLAARMRPSGDGFLIAVNDTAARYPITVDPLIVAFERQLDAGNSDFNYSFGANVALDGDTMVAGCPTDSTRASSGGAVLVFVRVSGVWVLQQKLYPANPGSTDRFGSAVAISGNTIVAGSPGDDLNEVSDTDYGSACVFVRSGSIWTQQAKLLPDQRAVQTNFGFSVAISGDDIAIGAPVQYTASGLGSGRAFHYRRTGATWSAPFRLFSGLENDSDQFGYAVAVSAGNIVVGSPGSDRVGTDSGSIHVFTPVGNLWSSTQLLPSNGAASDRFGEAISIDGDTIAAGVYRWDFSAISHTVGTTYLFRKTGGSPGTWSQQQILLPSDAQTESRFGASVSLSGNTLAIGALDRKTYIFTTDGASPWVERTQILPDAAEDLRQPGSVVALSGGTLAMGIPRFFSDFIPGMLSVFTGSGATWSRQESLFLPEGGYLDHFGLCVDIDNGIAIVGALDDDTAAGADAGSAYIFRNYGSLWKFEQKLEDPQAAAGDRFGVAVAISGGRVAIGADYDDETSLTNCGSVSIFSRTSGTWAREGVKFTGPTASSNFGRSVAIDGDTFVAGAPGRNSQQGIISIHRNTGGSWTSQVIQSPVPQSGAQFGYAVAISGNRIIAGEPRLDITYAIIGPQVDCGSAHIFSRPNPGSTWSLTRSYPGDTANTRVGYSVAIDGDTAVIGCGGGPEWTGSPAENPRIGNAFVATHSGGAWSSLTVLPATGLASGAYFGQSVAVSGDIIAVGAYGRESMAGIVRLFQRSGTSWIKQADITEPGGENDNAFGNSTAISGDILIVGSYGAGVSDPGAASIFRIARTVPVLTITRSGTNALLTWPATPGWTLHRSSNLLPDSWTPVTVATDGTHTHAISPAVPRMFFRLQQP